MRDSGKSGTPEIDSWYTCTIASLENACPHASLPGPWPWLLALPAWGFWRCHRNKHTGHTAPVWPVCCALGRRGLKSRPTQTLPNGASGSGRTPRCASRARSPRRSGSYSRHPSAPRTCAGCRRQCKQVYARRSARVHRAALDEEAVAASDSTLPFVRSHHTSYEQLCQEEPGAARGGR